MNRIAILALVAFGYFGLKFLGVFPDRTTVAGIDGDNNVVQTVSGDPEIEASRIEARKYLSRFLDEAKSPPSSWQTVTLKAALQGETTVENIWISDFRETTPGTFEGLLANDPVDLPGKAAGDRVTFTQDQIVDWAYVEGGRGYGFFSAHALLGKVSAEEAAGMRAFLAETPVPPGW